MLPSSAIYRRVVCKPTFRRNVSPPSSGSKISRVINKRRYARGFLARLIFDPEDIIQQRRFTYGLHGAISQKMATFKPNLLCLNVKTHSGYAEMWFSKRRTGSSREVFVQITN
jgi:hypothetical protein